ncbi:MAG: ribbon-helix-helix protein, CopG family [Deltaproteobacteria bacterium]
MSTQMLIRINEDLKEKLKRLSRREGKTTSQKVRELIEGYIKDNDMAPYIDEIWNRIGSKLAEKGVQEADIEKAAAEVRKKKR